MSNNIALKIETTVVLMFSIVVMASITPTFGDISNVLVVVYYLFVPGYVMAGLLGENYGPIQRILFSLPFGLAMVLSLFAIRQMNTSALRLPYAVIIPALTLLLLAYRYFHARPLPT